MQMREIGEDLEYRGFSLLCGIIVNQPNLYVREMGKTYSLLIKTFCLGILLPGNAHETISGKTS